jgi:hypothetical protein
LVGLFYGLYKNLKSLFCCHYDFQFLFQINIKGSEVEIPQGLKRAESCESVASDSSVLEMQPDMPKIGQMEFALEYDR